MAASAQMLVIFCSLISTVYSSLQFAAVRGSLTCNGDSAEKVLIELWDRDVLSADDRMNQTTTDIMGSFEISGTEDEYMTIEPYLIIRHHCNAHSGCERQLRVKSEPALGRHSFHQLENIELAKANADGSDPCFAGHHV